MKEALKLRGTKVIHGITEPRPSDFYVHMLPFSNVEEFSNNEWPIVINTIIKDNVLIYGKPLDLAPKFISKTDLIEPLKNGLIKVRKSKDLILIDQYKEYLLKIIPKLKK